MAAAVYVDDLATAATYRGRGAVQAQRVGARYGHRWCHLFARPADRAALHAFAAALGMRREWWHRDHYDLVPPKRTLAVQRGAVEVTRREAVAIIGRRRRRRGA